MRKPMLTTDQLIIHAQDRSIEFEIMSADDAKKIPEQE